jgi:hypothetical protein
MVAGVLSGASGRKGTSFSEVVRGFPDERTAANGGDPARAGNDCARMALRTRAGRKSAVDIIVIISHHQPSFSTWGS